MCSKITDRKPSEIGGNLSDISVGMTLDCVSLLAWTLSMSP